MGPEVLDESMHKSVVLFGVSGGDTKEKESIMVVSTNNLGPTFNNGEAGVFSTIVLVVGMTLACAVAPCGSVVVMVGITLPDTVNPCDSTKFRRFSYFSHM